MQKLVAALFVNGKIVTGNHHGEAYSKLNNHEKSCSCQSGFFDPQQNRFVCDDNEFYVKKIIMVRHAEAEQGIDPGITELGRLQCVQTASFFKSLDDLQSYQGFTSPLARCQETAQVLCNEINLNFDVDCDLVDDDDEPHSLFIFRLKTLLKTLPDRSILISHCNFIANMAQLATGMEFDTLHLPNCSITVVENNNIVHIGKTL
jgi:broad specificity phosphatase PhoE